MADDSWVVAYALLFIVIVSNTSHGVKLNIGVLPESRDIVDNVHKVLPNPEFNLFYDIPVNSKLTFTKINEVHSYLKENKIHAVIGSYDDAVSIAAESYEAAFISTSPVPRSNTNYTVQMIPSISDFCQALLEMVTKNGWTKISVFYDSQEGVELLEKLATNHTFIIRAWRLSVPPTQSEARDALVKMRKFLVETSIVFCQDKRNIKQILDQARDLAMLSTSPYEWMFHDPGDQFSNLLTNYTEINVNFTIFNILPFSSFNFSNEPVHDRLRFALVADSFDLLKKTADLLDPSNKLSKKSERRKFMKEILKNKVNGTTGNLHFDEHGKRSDITIDLTVITGEKYFLKGFWKSKPEDKKSSLVLFPDQLDFNRSTQFPLKGRKVDIVTILEKPFTMLKRGHELRKGNDKFEGFAVDLIAKVAERLGFSYELYLVHDKKFGSRLPNGEWNGIIGELLAGNASMSVAPLSINSQREGAVDFTKPFMTRYISVLLRIPRRETSYFEFLNPLSPIVWLFTIGAFLLVSIVLYGLERIGLKAKHPHKISLRESFWFIFGSLLQGNTDASPSTMPGRILTSAWWFFALILISSYTANLAAFLTVKKINTPIKSVTDLAQQTKIKYGTVADSGVMSFFRNTNIEHFSKMWAQMSEIEPDSMVANTTVGYDKVKNEDYAFFWDTTVNRYKTIKDCNVMEIGPPFDPKGFGIGVPPGATYRDDLSMAILTLSDTGTLHELENKWWGSRDCPDLAKSSADETSELQLENVAGVFFILVGGICIAAFVCLGEYVAHLLIKIAKPSKAVPKPKEKENFL